MSTLEKAMGLLQVLPERQLDAVYMYMRFVYSHSDGSDFILAKESSVEKRRKGFQGLISFAGTLPEDFDYKQELEEAREEKYARFI